MAQHPITGTKNLRNSLKQFLRLKSEAPRSTECCPDCGLPLVYIVTQFWLDGDDDVWKIPLPYCLHCHPELATQIKAAA